MAGQVWSRMSSVALPVQVGSSQVADTQGVQFAS
jgi:uncharacterized protein YhbP (UPF0306 family)